MCVIALVKAAHFSAQLELFGSSYSREPAVLRSPDVGSDPLWQQCYCAIADGFRHSPPVCLINIYLSNCEKKNKTGDWLKEPGGSH